MAESDNPISKEYERHWLLKLSIAEAVTQGTITGEQFNELLAYLYDRLKIEQLEAQA